MCEYATRDKTKEKNRERKKFSTYLARNKHQILLLNNYSNLKDITIEIKDKLNMENRK